jgi:hypothetical protein
MSGAVVGGTDIAVGAAGEPVTEQARITKIASVKPSARFLFIFSFHDKWISNLLYNKAVV